MAKPTPGPWSSDSACGLYARNITGADGATHVATVLTGRPARSGREAWDAVEPVQYGAGNLALIEAAPNLLEALRWAVNFIDIYAREESGPATPELNKARRAIAKATGTP